MLYSIFMFAYNFPQISPHGKQPCRSTMHFPIFGHARDLHTPEFSHVGLNAQNGVWKSTPRMFTYIQFEYLFCNAFYSVTSFKNSTESIVAVSPTLFENG